MKRIKEGEIVVMKTDKSGKMCISTKEKYIELGMQHVKGDKEISREELRCIERILNGHGMSWSKMWGTGKAHNQEDRVMNSRVSSSENTSDLLVAFKDHKKEEKGRPIATGNSGNTRALSNAVSDFVEAVANSESTKIEVISSEDLLFNYKEHDKGIKELRKEIKAREIHKMNCNVCNIGKLRCLRCEAARPEVVAKNAGVVQECKGCTERWSRLMEDDCAGCGQGISPEERHTFQLGLALFPSITSERTGLIIRKRVYKSPMKMLGFEWKEGARYIAMSKHLTGPLGSLRKVIPFRRKTGGVEPGITSADVMSKKSKLEKQWYYPRDKITEEQERDIISRCTEIAVRTLFEKFTYNFGGKNYLQSKGGPIGARITMACARLVMQDWGSHSPEG